MIGTWIPEELQSKLTEQGLKIEHVCILVWAINFHKQGDHNRLNNQYLSARLRKSERQIRRMIEKLIKFGWLERELKKCPIGLERHLMPTKKALKYNTSI